MHTVNQYLTTNLTYSLIAFRKVASTHFLSLLQQSPQPTGPLNQSPIRKIVLCDVWGVALLLRLLQMYICNKAINLEKFVHAVTIAEYALERTLWLFQVKLLQVKRQADNTKDFHPVLPVHFFRFEVGKQAKLYPVIFMLT